jgi:hypothetical protein
VTEPGGAPLSRDDVTLYLGKTTSHFRAGASTGAAPLSDFANMCNRGVSIARTGLDNRVDHFTWSSRARRMRISPGDRWFESVSLQRRVVCEPGPEHHQPKEGLAAHATMVEREWSFLPLHT